MAGDSTKEHDKRRPSDFFVSYTEQDRSWAEWVAWQLEDSGFTTIIGSWEMVPGTNRLSIIQSAIIGSRRTIAIVSENYTLSLTNSGEWMAAYQSDPTGLERRLIPIRVEDCKPPGVLSNIVAIDLFDLSEVAAHSALIVGVMNAVDGTGKPHKKPNFPISPTPPRYPGNRRENAAQSHEFTPIRSSHRPQVTKGQSRHSRLSVPDRQLNQRPTSQIHSQGFERRVKDDRISKRFFRRTAFLTSISLVLLVAVTFLLDGNPISGAASSVEAGTFDSSHPSPQEGDPRDRFYIQERGEIAPLPNFIPPGTLGNPGIPSRQLVALGEKAVYIASLQKGKPFSAGASGPLEFDSPGLVWYAFRQVGYDLPRTMADQYRHVELIPQSEKFPGNIIFFGDIDGVHQVGIYAGNNFIWSTRPSGKVDLEKIDTDPYRVGRIRESRQYSSPINPRLI